MSGVSDYEAGNWGYPGMPETGTWEVPHQGAGLIIDGDHDGNCWSVRGGLLVLGPEGLHLAPGVAIYGSWTIQGPGFTGGDAAAAQGDRRAGETRADLPA